VLRKLCLLLLHGLLQQLVLLDHFLRKLDHLLQLLLCCGRQLLLLLLPTHQTSSSIRA
jgi:hypothetical protein